MQAGSSIVVTSGSKLPQIYPWPVGSNFYQLAAPTVSQQVAGVANAAASNSVNTPREEHRGSSVAYSQEELRKFRALPRTVQESLFGYETLVRSCFIDYAINGDASKSIEDLVRGAPEFLQTVDNRLYGESPLGKALLKKNQEASRCFIRLADSSGQRNAVLSHRNSAGHTLLMLAVDLDSSDCKDILVALLQYYPAQIYRFYDGEGRNVFHFCAVDRYAASFRIILDAVLQMDTVEISKSSILEALDMTDRFHKTPIHYIAESGDIEMFNMLDSFARSRSIVVDYDSRFKTSVSKTPLMVAVESNHFDVCKWLLEKGHVDVSVKQPVSCFTALHFAVKLGRPELIGLLRLHGASSEFYDDECEMLENYKTPLELVKEDYQIPNREICLEYLLKDKSHFKRKYEYTVDSLPRTLSVAGPSSLSSPSSSQSEAQQFNPAEFLRKKKIVTDLQLFSSERRGELSLRLARLGKSELFVDQLMKYVPDLEADFKYIVSSSDPVFNAITVLSDTEQASRFVIKQVLLDIEADELVELVIPATTS